MRFSKLLVRMAPAAFALVIGIPAGAAESAAAGTATESAGKKMIEEIIVTSRRAEEQIQDVPVAVSAFSEADLTRIAPNTLRDLDGLSPNVFIGMNTAGPSAGAIFIRGIGYADIEKTQSTQVGLIVDGIYQGTNTGQLVDMFDVEQVEINRGPQGVLYGKNTMGGMIVVTRVKPVMNDWHYAASVQGGNYDAAQYKGRVNIPLIDDKLALKLGAMSTERNGYYFNNTRKTNVGDIDYQTATAALLWEPTDKISALFTYDYINDNGDIPPQDPLYNGNNPFKNSADFNEGQSYDVDSVSLNVTWDVGFGTISSITGYVDAKDKVLQDFDGGSNTTSTASPLSQLHTLRDQEYKQFTQELRFSGDINDTISYTVGGFYYDTQQDFYQGTNITVQIAVPAPNICGFIGLSQNPTQPFLCQIKNAVVSGQEVSEDVTSWAGFGQVNWNVLPSVELSYGMRYIYEERDFQSALFNAAVPFGGIFPPQKSQIVGGPLPGFPVKSDNDWDKTVSKVSATWLVTDENTLYVSFSQGFRSGGFSLRGNDPEFISFKPETANAWEIGSKNDLWDGRWRLNLAAFLTKQKDAQFSTIIQTPLQAPGTNTIINNGVESEIYGFELESTIVATDYLSFVASYGVQGANSDDLTISSRRYPFPLNNGTPAQNQNCNPTVNPAFFPNAPATTPNTCPDVDVQAGNLFRAPHTNWSLTAIYDMDIWEGNLNASVAFHGMDRFFIGVVAQEPLYQRRYSLLDLNVTYQWNMQRGDQLRLSLLGKNVLNEEYLEQYLNLGGDAANGTGFSGFQGWGPPRTWAVELSFLH